MPPEQGAQPLITIRAAVVVLVAFVCGLFVGGFTFATDRSVAGAVLAGGIAFGAAVPVVNSLVGRT